MTVEFTDEAARRSGPTTELLWRGVTMLRYEKGALAATVATDPDGRQLPPDRGRVRPHEIRQKIKLEPNDSPTLFGIRPIRDGRSRPARAAT